MYCNDSSCAYLWGIIQPPLPFNVVNAVQSISVFMPPTHNHRLTQCHSQERSSCLETLPEVRARNLTKTCNSLLDHSSNFKKWSLPHLSRSHTTFTLIILSSVWKGLFVNLGQPLYCTDIVWRMRSHVRQNMSLFW